VYVVSIDNECCDLVNKPIHPPQQAISKTFAAKQYHLIFTLFESPQYWFSLLLVVVVALLPEFFLHLYVFIVFQTMHSPNSCYSLCRTWFPKSSDIIHEIQIYELKKPTRKIKQARRGRRANTIDINALQKMSAGVATEEPYAHGHTGFAFSQEEGQREVLESELFIFLLKY